MKKTILIIVVVIIGALYLSSAYAQSDTSNGAVSPDAISAQIVSKINVLDSVNLNINGNLFKNPLFTSLQDHSRPLPDQEIGRNNPFAPIGQ